jgi:hypothetical protein
MPLGTGVELESEFSELAQLAGDATAKTKKLLCKKIVGILERYPDFSTTYPVSALKEHLSETVWLRFVRVRLHLYRKGTCFLVVRCQEACGASPSV